MKTDNVDKVLITIGAVCLGVGGFFLGVGYEDKHGSVHMDKNHIWTTNEAWPPIADNTPGHIIGTPILWNSRIWSNDPVYEMGFRSDGVLVFRNLTTNGVRVQFTK